MFNVIQSKYDTTMEYSERDVSQSVQKVKTSSTPIQEWKSYLRSLPTFKKGIDNLFFQ